MYTFEYIFYFEWIIYLYTLVCSPPNLFSLCVCDGSLLASCGSQGLIEVVRLGVKPLPTEPSFS